jgi:hypothetical protein
MGKKLPSSIKMASKLNIHLLLLTLINQCLLYKNNEAPLWVYSEGQNEHILDECRSFRDTHYIRYLNMSIKFYSVNEFLYIALPVKYQYKYQSYFHMLEVRGDPDVHCL